jgi:hypothetical protein
MRSRVIPGSSPTIDRREPVNRLNSVLLPTFGRPQTAINGRSRASALSVSVTICEASSSISRQSSSRPSIFDDRGVWRPTIPSAGLTCFTRGAVPFGVLAEAAPSVRIALRFSLSGDCFVTLDALSAAARLVESTFRFRGSTAPVVGVALGARPFFGRVDACLCFLPNRFLSSRCAIDRAFSRHRSAFPIIGSLATHSGRCSSDYHGVAHPDVYNCSHLDHTGLT